MKIIITPPILKDLLAGESQTAHIFFHHNEIELQFYAPAEIADHLDVNKENILKEIFLVPSDLYLPHYDTAMDQVVRPKDAFYFAAYLLLKHEMDGIWTKSSFELKEHTDVNIFSTQELLQLFPESDIEQISIPITKEVTTADDDSFKVYTSKIADKAASSTTNASNPMGATTMDGGKFAKYGDKNDFDWLEDDRLDPMFYEKFLHFHGLKCLNDDQIYYLEPEGEGKPLPLPSEISKEEVLWQIVRVDTGYEEVFQFDIYKILQEEHKWENYWELFIQKGKNDKFQAGCSLLETNKDQTSLKRTSLSITNEPKRAKTSRIQKETTKEIKLKEYSSGHEIFTTKLSFQNFSLPEGWLKMTPDEGKDLLGVDLKIIGKAWSGLRIKDKTYGVRLLNDLASDNEYDTIDKEIRDVWEDDYDLFFEKGDS